MNTKKITPQEETDFLKENYREMTNAELALHFGISKGAVASRMFGLGLKRDPSDTATLKVREQRKEQTPGIQSKRIETLHRRPSLQDVIEETYPEPVIRQMYAKLSYGVKKQFPFEEVPKELQREAFNLDYSLVIGSLSKEWKRFA